MNKHLTNSTADHRVGDRAIRRNLNRKGGFLCPPCQFLDDISCQKGEDNNSYGLQWSAEMASAKDTIMCEGVTDLIGKRGFYLVVRGADENLDF